VSLLTYNAQLSEEFKETIRQISNGNWKTLDSLCELHLCVMSKAAMEGAGILRFTEAVSGLFSSPSQLARRTLYWEDQQLNVAYDWSKVGVE
jgi:hypothetical protein